MSQSKKAKKIGKCKICCQRVNDLKRGHIFPEWSAKLGGLMSSTLIYRPVNLPNLVEENTPPTTEYLFCGRCEENLGVGEDEIRRTFLSPNSDKGKTNIRLTANHFPFFYYHTTKKHLIQRAALGIIFKAHLSKEKHYEGIYLTKNLFRKIQKYLQTNEGLPYLDISVSKFFNFTEGAYYHYDYPKETMIGNPLSINSVYRIDDDFYVFLAGIIIKVTFDPGQYGRTPYGIPCTIGDIRYAKKITHDTYIPTTSTHPNVIRELKEDILAYDLLAPCPCGLSWTNKGKILERRKFEECCHPIWFSENMKEVSVNQNEIRQIFGEEKFREYICNPPKIMATTSPEIIELYHVDLEKVSIGKMHEKDLRKYYYQNYRNKLIYSGL